jgi:hypothetical protein
VGKGEYSENIDILLYLRRRSQVKGGKHMVLRPKSRPLHILGTYLRF